MPVLAQRFTVIAPDLPGIGDIPSGEVDMTTVASRIHTLARSLGADRAKVVGHDIGLMVAYAYAAQFPADVDRLVVMDAFLPGVGDGERFRRRPCALDPGCRPRHLYRRLRTTRADACWLGLLRVVSEDGKRLRPAVGAAADDAGPRHRRCEGEWSPRTSPSCSSSFSSREPNGRLRRLKHMNTVGTENKRLLEAELDDLVARLQGEARVPGASVGSDFLDVAQGIERQEQARLTVLRLTERAKRLQTALNRFSTGEYGVCSECGTAISPRRLHAMPDVTTCVACQERLERNAG